MKLKTTIYTTLIALAIALGTAVSLSQSEDSTSKDIKHLTLQVKADKQHYLPGEVITLDFKIKNDSNEPVLLPKSVDVQSGQLQVFIADESNEYNQYIGPRWGLADVFVKKAVKLAPGESFETTATVLHNHRVEASHLSEIAAAEIAKGRIKTEYALPNPGMYFIKAVLNDDQMANKIESEPIRIIIEEPQGQDLEVWNRIKGDGNFALFMQTGEIVERPNGPKTKQIVATLREIENSFPMAKYVGRIHAGLDKHRDLLEKQKNK